MEEYFTLRRLVLKRFHQLPPGAERDDLDLPGAGSQHVTVRNAAGELVGGARLHLNSPAEAQIRYLAVSERCQGQGVGRILVERLEALARQRGARTVMLVARNAVVVFYERLGYQVRGKVPEIFDPAEHVRMEKVL